MYRLKRVNAGENHFNSNVILPYSRKDLPQNGHEDDKLEVLEEVETPDKLADFFLSEN